MRSAGTTGWNRATRFLGLVAFTSLVVGVGQAQLGRPLGAPLDIGKLIGNPNIQGMTYGPGAHPAKPGTSAGDYLWVTASRVPLNGTGPHLLYQLEIGAWPNLKLLKIYPAPAGVNASGQGLYDPAYMRDNFLIYAGTETKITKTLFAFDCLNLKWDGTRNIQTNTNLASFRGLAGLSGRTTLLAGAYDGSLESIDTGSGNVTGQYQPATTKINSLGALCIRGYKNPNQFYLASFNRAGSSMTSSLYPGSQAIIRVHSPAHKYRSGLITYADPSIPPMTGQAQGGLAIGMVEIIDPVLRYPVLLCIQRGTGTMLTRIDGTFDHGGGCPTGTNRMPIPGAMGDAPYAGNQNWQPFVLAITGCQSAFLFLGNSRLTWGAYQLPLSLSPFGLGSACQVQAAWEILVGCAAVGANDYAHFTLPIPKSPILVGSSIYGQWLISDRGVKGGLLTSGGFGLVIK